MRTSPLSAKQLRRAYCGTALGLAALAVAGLAAGSAVATSAQAESSNPPGSMLPVSFGSPATPGLPEAATTAPGAAVPGVTAPIVGNSELRARLSMPTLAVAGEKLNLALLQRFYAGHGWEPVWASRAAPATALLSAVMRASEHGMDPALFHTAALANPGLSPIDRDLLLSDAFLGYGEALARGAIPLEMRMDDEDLMPEPVDVVAVLDGAIMGPNPASALEALAPATPEYTAMRRAYKGYATIAAGGGWPHVGDGAAHLAALQQRLAAEGYLPQGYHSGSYDAATSAAVRAFQQHHDLGADGRLSGSTVAELNVPANVRALQVAINMERLRWLPRNIPADRVWVNTADARLTLYRQNQPVFTTRVVVGETDKQTPELQSTISSLLYNPPWNVPPSIARSEIMPRVARDPGYLARHHMRLRGNGAIQQLPGPGTALGQLKFEMTNRFDVYLHDTPSKALFSRDNRRLSHGCVRVQNPRELAALLSSQSVEAINKGIARGYTNRHELPSPIRVFLVYQTAFAAPDGSIEFRRDFYERDDNIRQHLVRPQQVPVAERQPAGQRRG